MHDDHRHICRCGSIQRTVTAKTANIIDDPCPRRRGTAHHLAMAGVDGNKGIFRFQSGNRRQHPRQFLIAGHCLGAGAC